MLAKELAGPSGGFYWSYYIYDLLQYVNELWFLNLAFLYNRTLYDLKVFSHFFVKKKIRPSKWRPYRYILYILFSLPGPSSGIFSGFANKENIIVFQILTWHTQAGS
jgi:hypothetical protein